MGTAKTYCGSGKRMLRPRMASKSVKLQSPYEGHRVQSLLLIQDEAAHPTDCRLDSDVHSGHRWNCVARKL